MRWNTIIVLSCRYSIEIESIFPLRFCAPPKTFIAYAFPYYIRMGSCTNHAYMYFMWMVHCWSRTERFDKVLSFYSNWNHAYCTWNETQSFVFISNQTILMPLFILFGVQFHLTHKHAHTHGRKYIYLFIYIYMNATQWADLQNWYFFLRIDGWMDCTESNICWLNIRAAACEANGKNSFMVLAWEERRREDCWRQTDGQPLHTCSRLNWNLANKRRVNEFLILLCD